jgi:hypothetical protein
MTTTAVNRCQWKLSGILEKSRLRVKSKSKSKESAKTRAAALKKT